MVNTECVLLHSWGTLCSRCFFHIYNWTDQSKKWSAQKQHFDHTTNIWQGPDARWITSLFVVNQTNSTDDFVNDSILIQCDATETWKHMLKQQNKHIVFVCSRYFLIIVAARSKDRRYVAQIRRSSWSSSMWDAGQVFQPAPVNQTAHPASQAINQWVDQPASSSSQAC